MTVNGVLSTALLGVILLIICTVLYFGGWSAPAHVGELRYSLQRRLPGEECHTTCPVVGLESISQYRAYISTIETNCTSLRQFGGHPPAPSHGRKYVCLDERFNIKPDDCHVISFGVNHEWSFEDDVAKFGCKVYAFDPTMGVKDHKRSANIQFYATGIGNYKGLMKIGSGLRKVDRYENLVNQLGLAGRVIDCVKIDVELSEVYFLQDVVFNSPHLLRKIKQIAMEVHHGGGVDLNPKSLFLVYWPYFMILRCHGFRIIASRSGNNERTQEIVWAREEQW
ncbi:probable methyltransferase-like protein 24 [Panulirus ornatus]|uniref:probable methyltransferase-like protein 24 n=1 Tax=Panulirus ornatus TaxID=150431 RepID=UPI003A8B7331